MSQSHGVPLGLTDSDIARHRAMVLVTATCHVWMGAVGSDGYGRFSLRPEPGGKQRTVTPHQVAGELMFGPIEAGLTYLHDCDFRLCCRAQATPGHLRVSTQGENVRQAVWRGRSRGPHPGLVDVRGKRGVALAVQDALDLAEDRTPEGLAAVLAAALAEGDPLAGTLALFDPPANT